ncbi:MAG: hypothetical protein GY696_05435 [Gammaproteobacteria bacterium]|nr:hypothetical protein [Gammaproteobacteria bacterium]
MRGRGETAVSVIVDGVKELQVHEEGLIILEPQNIISVNIMQQVHDYTHGGVQAMLARSCAYTWITNGRKLAEKVVKSCALCSIEIAKLCSLRIADVTEDWLIPTKPFEVVQIDLAGPLKVMKQGARLKKHAPEKSVWVLVVTCQFSRAVFLDALESYLSDSLLIGLKKLEATYRHPSKIISDAGTQMVGAKNKLEKPYANTTVFEWKVVPTAAHHFIGGAERIMGMMKRMLKRKLEGAAISHNKLSLFLLEVAKMMNTRPLVAET